jgi:hypothetical protein
MDSWEIIYHDFASRGFDALAFSIYAFNFSRLVGEFEFLEFRGRI